MSEEERKEKDKNLEYNDGLGDLLKEKEKYVFSWPKTIIVVIIIIGIILVALSIIFSWGKTKIIEENVLIKKSAPTKSTLLEKTQKHKIKQKTPPKKSSSSKKDKVKQTKKADLNQKKHPKSHPQKKGKTNLKVLSSKTSSIHYQAVIKKHPYKVITGTFKTKENALKQKRNLQKNGFDAFIWISYNKKKTKFYKVQSGAFATKKEAKKYQKKISLKGFQSYIIHKNK